MDVYFSKFLVQRSARKKSRRRILVVRRLVNVSPLLYGYGHGYGYWLITDKMNFNSFYQLISLTQSIFSSALLTNCLFLPVLRIVFIFSILSHDLPWLLFKFTSSETYEAFFHFPIQVFVSITKSIYLCYLVSFISVVRVLTSIRF